MKKACSKILLLYNTQAVENLNKICSTVEAKREDSIELKNWNLELGNAKFRSVFC